MVNNVPLLTSAEVNNLSIAERAKYIAATPEEKAKIALDFRNQNKPNEPDSKGTAVETNADAAPLTEEQQQEKQAAMQRRLEETEAAKRAAAEAQQRAAVEAEQKAATEAQQNTAAETQQNAAAMQQRLEKSKAAESNPTQTVPQTENNNADEIAKLKEENARLREQLAQKAPTEEATDIAEDVAEAPVTEAPKGEETKQKRKFEEAYAPEVLNNFEREQMARALEEAGTDKPLYKSAKARRELRKNIKEELYQRISDSIDENSEGKDAKTIKREKRLAKKVARQGAKAIAKDIAIGDKIEHTRVVDSYDEKREMKDSMTRGERRDFRVKKHAKRFISEENANLHTRIQQEEIGSHEAAIRLVDDNSGDRTFDPNEVRRTASESSNVKSRDAVAKRELKRLGYKVKDDTWKNILAGLGTGLATGAGAAALPVMFEAVVKTAVTLDDLTVIAQNVRVEGKVTPWKNAAIAGGIAGVLAGALFGGTEDEDVLHGTAVEGIFKDDPNGKRAYENMSFGSKTDTEKVKLIMREIDKLDLTDAEKTGFLAAAAGEDGQQILSKKELVLAYVDAALDKDPEIAKLMQEIIEKECPECPECPPAADEAPADNKPADEPPVDDKPVEEAPADNKPVEDKPADDKPVDDKPAADEPPAEPEKPTNGGQVTVMNGESFNKLAKKYGVDVNELKELNKDKIHSHKDCDGKRHYYFRVGETITLPDGANQDAVAHNIKNVKKQDEINKYTNAVTSDKNIKSHIIEVDGKVDVDCDKTVDAEGTQVKELVNKEIERIKKQKQEEAKKAESQDAKGNPKIDTKTDSTTVAIKDTTLTVTPKDSIKVKADSTTVKADTTITAAPKDSVQVKADSTTTKADTTKLRDTRPTIGMPASEKNNNTSKIEDDYVMLKDYIKRWNLPMDKQDEEMMIINPPKQFSNYYKKKYGITFNL